MHLLSLELNIKFVTDQCLLDPLTSQVMDDHDFSLQIEAEVITIDNPYDRSILQNVTINTCKIALWI